MQELIVIFVVAILVIGPKRLPEMGRAIGKVMGQLRGVVSDVKSEVEREIRLSETGLDIDELPAWKTRDELAAGGPVEGKKEEGAQKAGQPDSKAQAEGQEAQK